MKGFLSFSPLAVIHFPPDVTTSKLCDDFIIGNSVRRCALQTVWFISAKKLANFGIVVGVSLSGKLKVIFENF